MSNTNDDYKSPVDRWGKNALEIFSELMKEQGKEYGIDRYIIFDSSSEGEIFPSGLESEAFWVMNLDGMVWDCLLKWDDNKIAPDGTKGYYYLKFRSVEMQGCKGLHYLQGRRRLNFPFTKEQERILRELEEEYPMQSHNFSGNKEQREQKLREYEERIKEEWKKTPII